MSQLPMDFTTSIFLVTMYVTRPSMCKFCVHGRDGHGSGKASAKKVVYGKYTDKITTVYDYHNSIAHAR